MRILVVEDDPATAKSITMMLESADMVVDSTDLGEDGLEIGKLYDYDLIILDLMLPGIDGLEVARRLKQNTATNTIPIVMLTAKGEEADVVAGLELGADDYVTKPFSPRILMARMKAVIRRRSGDANLENEVLTIRELSIHTGRRHVTANGKALDLTYTEFQVLYFLARRPGWVFTRSQIVDAVRGDDYPVTDRSVDVQIVGLRKKLGSLGHYIETVRGVGYRFIEN